MTLPDAASGAPAPALSAPLRAEPSERRLDLRGLHCPMPVLRARKALREIAVGAGLAVECTDPLSAIDIPHFVAEAGHELVGMHRDGDLFTYHIVRRR